MKMVLIVGLFALLTSLTACVSNGDYASVNNGLNSDHEDGKRASIANSAFPHHDRAKGYSKGGS